MAEASQTPTTLENKVVLYVPSDSGVEGEVFGSVYSRSRDHLKLVEFYSVGEFRKAINLKPAGIFLSSMRVRYSPDEIDPGIMKVLTDVEKDYAGGIQVAKECHYKSVPYLVFTSAKQSTLDKLKPYNPGRIFIGADTKVKAIAEELMRKFGLRGFEKFEK